MAPMHMKNSTGGMSRFTGNVCAVSFAVVVRRPGLALSLFGSLGQNQLAVACLPQHIVGAVVLDEQNIAFGEQCIAADVRYCGRWSFGNGFWFSRRVCR